LADSASAKAASAVLSASEGRVRVSRLVPAAPRAGGVVELDQAELFGIEAQAEPAAQARGVLEEHQLGTSGAAEGEHSL
jgi:hypothetical protein